jgi:hypothetical protein
MLDRNKSMKNGFVGKEKKRKVKDTLTGDAVQTKIFLLKFNMFYMF